MNINICNYKVISNLFFVANILPYPVGITICNAKQVKIISDFLFGVCFSRSYEIINGNMDVFWTVKYATIQRQVPKYINICDTFATVANCKKAVANVLQVTILQII